MSILIVGNNGNMGRRYEHICRWYGRKTIGIDVGDKIPRPTEVDRAIIATPTDSHIEAAMWCAHYGIPFLCEKPISKNIGDVTALRDVCRKNESNGYMVCNWSFTGHGKRYCPGTHTVSYDCWNTGKDGLWWDCIQLVALAIDKNNISLKNESPTFFATIDGMIVGLDTIAHSYVMMIHSFLNSPDDLWSLDVAVDATKRVIDWGAN